LDSLVALITYGRFRHRNFNDLEEWYKKIDNGVIFRRRKEKYSSQIIGGYIVSILSGKLFSSSRSRN